MSLVASLLDRVSPQSLQQLRASDRAWQALRLENPVIPAVINQSQESLGETDFDLVIAGGTLGIFIGAALQTRGWRVALLERGILRGREQEWNISRLELSSFLELDLLTEAELNQAIATEYNPGRVGFYQGYELWVRDILNIGVDPVYLLETLKTRLLIDAMGHFSAIAKQARKGEKPDGVCLVVGSCGQGFPSNETGDLIYSFTPILHQCQYFWEAFPARD
ncbi:MAG: FAD-binding oxidoreductase, partial [Microcystis sp.]